MASKYSEQLATLRVFEAKRSANIPESKKRADECFPPNIFDQAAQLIAAGDELVNKPGWTQEAKNEAARHEAVLEETETMSREMYHLVLFHSARHPELDDTIQPRIGDTSDAHVTNLRGMSARLDDEKTALKKAIPEFVLPARLMPEAVDKQAIAHVTAEAALETLGVRTDATQRQLMVWGAKATKLQTRINKVLDAFFSGDRGLQLKWGYQERARSRRAPAQPAQPAPTDAKPTDA